MSSRMLYEIGRRYDDSIQSYQSSLLTCVADHLESPASAHGVHPVRPLVSARLSVDVRAPPAGGDTAEPRRPVSSAAPEDTGNARMIRAAKR